MSMNKLILIGNLTKAPELRTTQDGTKVCNFDIAVNDKRSGQNSVQYFRVNAWRQLGELCAKYLAKGRKVFVSGALSYHTYQAADGSTRVQLEVTADDVEFLSSRSDDSPSDTDDASPAAPVDSAPTAQNNGFTAVETDDLPF